MLAFSASNKVLVIKLTALDNGLNSESHCKLDGKASIEKNIPDENIDMIDTKRFIKFPCLKYIIKEADIMPIPIYGSEKNIIKKINIGIFE